MEVDVTNRAIIPLGPDEGVFGLQRHPARSAIKSLAGVAPSITVPETSRPASFFLFVKNYTRREDSRL